MVELNTKKNDLFNLGMAAGKFEVLSKLLHEFAGGLGDENKLMLAMSECEECIRETKNIIGVEIYNQVRKKHLARLRYAKGQSNGFKGLQIQNT